MRGRLLRAKVLSAKIISNLSDDLIKNIEIPNNYRSIGIVTADIDDVTYVALDEATKVADVKVVYAKSLYAGSANASTKLAGEVIGIIAGDNPSEVKSGLNRTVEFIEKGPHFTSANMDDTIPYFSYCVSRTGSFLSKLANIKEGEPLAYLIAPPLESIYGLDKALKSADVKMVSFFGPPSETNFGGGLLTGTQSACKAACDAFSSAINFVADNPKLF